MSTTTTANLVTTTPDRLEAGDVLVAWTTVGDSALDAWACPEAQAAVHGDRYTDREWTVEQAVPAEFCPSYSRPRNGMVRVHFSDCTGSRMDLWDDTTCVVVRN